MADKIKKYRAGDVEISVDRTKCISCGLCTEIAPKTFELDKDMISVVKKEEPHDNPDKIKEAVESCATGAITLEE